MNNQTEHKRRLIVNSIIGEIKATPKEKYHTYGFGSSDRKGYTIKITLEWQEEYMETSTEVQQWEDQVDERVESIIKESKYRFAEEIYNKNFK